MSLDSYALSDFPGQQYKLDLGQTHQTLLLTIQTRLVQTRWQLNEEREERMRLEHRPMHSDPPPSATSEDMSVSPSSDSTLMDFEEDPLWEKDGGMFCGLRFLESYSMCNYRFFVSEWRHTA